MGLYTDWQTKLCEVNDLREQYAGAERTNNNVVVCVAFIYIYLDKPSRDLRSD